jgi:hypothetical protein
MSDKVYGPKEAALAVLKKAEELYKSSNLAKGDWAKIHSKLKREGYSEESADKIDGAIKAKLGKSEMKKDDMAGNSQNAPMMQPATTPPMGKAEANPDEKADAALGEEVERDVEQHEKTNQDPKHQMKGHIKLAKFMGAIEQKRGTRAK